jgi:hypothetical protein
VHFRLSPVLLERLDVVADAWSVSRSAAVRRLIETADVDGVDRLPMPTMDELIAIAAEKARGGNMAAMSFLAARQPDEREAEFARLLSQLGADPQGATSC